MDLGMQVSLTSVCYVYFQSTYLFVRNISIKKGSKNFGRIEDTINWFWDLLTWPSVLSFAGARREHSIVSPLRFTDLYEIMSGTIKQIWFWTFCDYIYSNVFWEYITCSGNMNFSLNEWGFFCQLIQVLRTKHESLKLI